MLSCVLGPDRVVHGSMARRKRALSDVSASLSSSSDSSLCYNRLAQHRKGYYSVLADEYPFLTLVKDNEGKVIGLVCLWCMKHKTDHAGTWTIEPCTCIHEDVIAQHSYSAMHCEAIEKETLCRQSWWWNRTGLWLTGMTQRRAVVVAIKMIYWLAKEEVAHTTKWVSARTSH